MLKRRNTLVFTSLMFTAGCLWGGNDAWAAPLRMKDVVPTSYAEKPIVEISPDSAPAEEKSAQESPSQSDNDPANTLATDSTPEASAPEAPASKKQESSEDSEERNESESPSADSSGTTNLGIPGKDSAPSFHDQNPTHPKDRSADEKNELSAIANRSSGLPKDKDHKMTFKDIKNFHWPPDMSVKLGDHVRFTPGLLLQVRYTFNYRDEPIEGERKITQGFNLPRAFVFLVLDVTQYFTMFTRFGVNSGGQLGIERAFVDVKPNPLVKIRVGQFYLPFIDEQDPRAADTQLVDYATSGNTFQPGATEGAMLILFPWKMRISTAISNGLRTGFSQIEEPFRADYAVSEYVELRAIGKNWSPFDFFSSFRGSPLGLKFGVGGHWQQGGSTGTTADANVGMLAADVTLKANGWSLFGQWFGSSIWLQPDFVNYNNLQYKTYRSMGAVLQGGVFVIPQLELAARYDFVYSDGKSRPVQLNANAGGAYQWFRTATAGLNFFPIPKSFFAHLSLDFMYMFDPQEPSIVLANPDFGLVSTITDPQWAFRLQWTLQL